LIIFFVFQFLLFSGCDKINATNDSKTSECTDTIGCVYLNEGEPFKIAVLQALSGDIAPLGQEQIRGLELAMERWNNTIANHPISLQIEDSGCTPEGGANAALKVIADPQTIAIFGTTCSGSAVTASKIMSKAGLTMISGNNSAQFLTSVNGKRATHWQAGYFRTAANDEHAGKAAAIFAWHELKVKKAATINDGDIYTTGMTIGFINAFKQLGGDVVLDAAINKGDKEMQPVIEAVKLSGAEFVFFPLFQPEGNHLLIQAKKTAGMEKIIMMTDGALIENSFIQSVKDYGKGVYFVGPSYYRGIGTNNIKVSYTKKYGESPSTSYYLCAFDAAMLLFKAIEAASSKEKDGTLRIGRQALRDALYHGREIEGVSGSLNCDLFGDCAYPVFNVLRLDEPNGGVEALQSNVIFVYNPNTSE
ncbi:MAG: branched-chain amino acid ABC transporter substrate-binding protein, partial [Desulfamplus sp.]|nr:branched-chain amino acid ABC transporter substrate-binding protein [Desulfamplus sp.]